MMKHFTFLLALCAAFIVQGQSLDLPITFDNSGINYDLRDFGGASSSIVTDPTNSSNKVLQQEKPTGAETWAGTVAGDAGLANKIAFSAGSTIITCRVWAATSGLVVRMKVEDKTNGGISVETEAITTVANGWSTLSFNFANQSAGTPPINFSNTYDKVVLFSDFGSSGSGTVVYYDDIMLGSSSGMKQVDLPITFDASDVDYSLISFGGALESIVVDPTNAANKVMKQEKPTGVQTWAGTIVGSVGLANKIPFMAGSTIITCRVWAPASGMPIRMKVENSGDPTISVETEVTTTVANGWNDLSFNFANQAAGTAPINLSNTYNKLVVFSNFGNTGTGTVVYYDDIMFGAKSTLKQVDLPITFDNDSVDYGVLSFGGVIESIVVDPTNANNKVLSQEKPTGAETWGGTILGTSGLVTKIPFAAGSTKMRARIWSPSAGTPVLMKVEDASNGTISVETVATTTSASVWETLTFDFSNNAAGTPAIDFSKTYDKVIIFCDFGNAGSGKTFYVDDVAFGAGGTNIEKIDWVKQFTVYPNPSNGIIHISGQTDITTEITISVLDITGRVIMESTIESLHLFNQALDLSAASNGLYIVRLSSSQGSTVQRISISR